MNSNDIKKISAAGAVLTLAACAVCLFIKPVCAALCLISGAAVTAVCAFIADKRRREIDELNNYLTLVCAGNFELDIASNSEGEISILKNNLYKVMILLRSQNEELSRDRVYLADSLADISHQLKTPLTSATVMVDLLKEETDGQRRQEFISIAEGQLEKMKWLITNLLKLSRLDAGTADFKYENVSAKRTVEESVRPFLIAAQLGGIAITDSSEDFIYRGDIGWTCEALKNIIKNCTEHTGRNGSIVISSVKTNIYNSITVTDDGCGISKEDLPHIFERFYHGKNASPDSVGIGLALAKTIMQKEKGDILVKSEEGRGTCFELRFYKSVI